MAWKDHIYIKVVQNGSFLLFGENSTNTKVQRATKTREGT